MEKKRPKVSWVAQEEGNANKQSPLWKKRVIFVLGGPGSGKGTQCKKIKQHYGEDNVCHLSAGDLLRAEAEIRSSPYRWEINFAIKNGLLVRPEITISLLKKAMLASDASTYLVDGFPRDLQQGFDFEAQIREADYVLFFDCPDEEIIKRVQARAKASAGHVRADDNMESLKRRMETFRRQTLPVIEYYADHGKVKSIDASRGIDEIFEDVLENMEN
eukprot:TRINITY_DN15238_c0_g1_i1.p1 TRINITY_DN15238_c0_g1~~TRINITY_DN15238_c0_g1_i1.p1  ORF type:complete len:217 (-),score=90.38 TRINITY_DN15238_c0_g1_i1:11-661(-)